VDAADLLRQLDRQESELQGFIEGSHPHTMSAEEGASVKERLDVRDARREEAQEIVARLILISRTQTRLLRQLMAE
jgi:hypothetical protein